MQVLDIGCGPGRLTIPISQLLGSHGHIVAMDIQDNMLKKVFHKAQEHGLSNITYLHAAVGERTLPHTSFDRIILVTVLGEIPDQKDAFLEVYEALKPGGIVSVTEIVFDPHYQRSEVVRHLATSVGLRECAYFSDWFAFTLNFKKPN